MGVTKTSQHVRPPESGTFMKATAGGDEAEWRTLPASPLPMWIFDPNTGEIAAANEPAERAYGYAHGELLGCCVRDLWPRQRQDPSDGLVSNLRAGDSLWTGTFEQRRKDGGTFEADIAMIETSDAARTAVMVVVLPTSDTTVGHECEAPGVKINSRTLLGYPKATAPVDGAPGSSFGAVDPRALALPARARVSDRARTKDVEVVIQCACSWVWVEPDAFCEALYELLDNAVRAARPGSAVMVDVRETADGDVLWQVQDSGEGMSCQALAQLGPPIPTARPGVLGLGVALAWGVIEAHGGLLRFESAPGVGTTASIWLPGHSVP